MCSKIRVPFFSPDVGEEEIRMVEEVLRSGWITTGPRTKELECHLAEYLGVSHTVCLNSQTACAEMALRLLGIGPGDEVITTAYTYTATAAVIAHVGAKIVLVDIAKDSLEMDYGAMEQAITERTKAVIPVDVGGVPCDYDRIFEIVERKRALFQPANMLQKAIGRVVVLSDSAHSLGATYKGKMTGNLADFSAFSFHAVKNFTTAEGGCLAWREIPGIDSIKLYKQLQRLSLHGQSKDALEKTKSNSWEYDIVGLYYKCNMTDIAAAMGLAQLRRYPEMLENRRRIVKKYDEAFLPLGIETLPHLREDRVSSCHLYITRVPGITGQERNEILERLSSEGVLCNVHYKPLPMHTAYRNLGFSIADFPNAKRYFENEITLPLYSRLTEEQANHVISTYTKIVKEYLVR